MLVFLVSLLLAVLRFLITSEIQRSICYVQSLVCSKVHARSTLVIGNFPPLGHLLVGLYLLCAGCWNYPRRPFFSSRGLFGLLLSILFWVFIYLFCCYICNLQARGLTKGKRQSLCLLHRQFLGSRYYEFPYDQYFALFFKGPKNVELIEAYLRPR